MNPELKALEALMNNFMLLRDQTKEEPAPQRMPGQYHLVHETPLDKQFRLGRHLAFAHAAGEVQHMIHMIRERRIS